jgi:exosortase D (VPLPA-CTERM-specific)
VALLLFMIPLPTVLQTTVGLGLRSISTQLGVGMLRILNVSVFVEGNLIDLGVTQLQVVDACSGLRYILPLLALGVIFAHYFQKTRWKQFMLVVATLPIAVFANSLRIAVTGYLAQNLGPMRALGFFHGFSGWLIFVFAIGCLIIFHLVLNAVFKKPRPTASRSSGHQRWDPQPVRFPFSAVGLSGLALLLVGAICHATTNLPPTPLAEGFAQFPMSIQNWQGRIETMDPDIVRQSGAEDALNATYAGDGGEIVSLYIGYRASPFTESENFFHSPDVCMPSQGWQTLTSSEHRIDNVPKFERMQVRKMVIEKMGLKQLVYYWFQTKDHISASVHVNRYQLTRHALSRDNTYDLFLRPISPIRPGESVDTAEKRLDQFVRAMMGELLVFLARQADLEH